MPRLLPSGSTIVVNNHAALVVGKEIVINNQNDEKPTITLRLSLETLVASNTYLVNIMGAQCRKV